MSMPPKTITTVGELVEYLLDVDTNTHIFTTRDNGELTAPIIRDHTAPEPGTVPFIAIDWH